MGQKDIKLLWGRSGNRCAICKIELTQDASSTNSTFTFGEQAHIVGEKEDAPRGKSQLDQKERDSYHNLILLCPNHHTTIDRNESDWSIEKLHQIKSTHELWVTEKLSETIDRVKLAKSTILAGIVDNAVTLCNLDNWHGWTSFALATDPQWSRDLPENTYKFRQKVISTIWPKEFDEFKRATITLSILLNQAAQTFMENSDLQGDSYIPFKFYKRIDPNPNYADDVKRYEQWLERCYSTIYEATKAANWFADVVRDYVNPMFFVEEGKFIIEQGMKSITDLNYYSELLEFTEEEKAKYPEKIFEIEDNALSR
ncbi:MAG: hypothetical protein DCF19_00795 [Pseudanabaena frigida]|uniref:HNH nuclease domain-containing protein n=1 Tax=Pseudanabaena frigida TaxID=945775 RepID=A0A2W4WTI3_9CYAN|nr:MAG: hypothetical protein DCF19_00795 [Pseudanabaena frigida]